MNKKALGIIFIVFGVIALIGTAAFIFVLFVIGQGISSINSADPALLAQTGTDPASIQTFYNQATQIMVIASIWAISLIIASLVSIHAGIRKLREKAKK